MIANLEELFVFQNLLRFFSRATIISRLKKRIFKNYARQPLCSQQDFVVVCDSAHFIITGLVHLTKLDSNLLNPSEWLSVLTLSTL